MEEVKKYILFQFDSEEPLGGMDDAGGSFDTVDEAKLFFSKGGYDCAQIVDRDTWKIVAINVPSGSNQFRDLLDYLKGGGK